MRPIGGEIELDHLTIKSYFTDSGRSSLRLFLRSGQNRHKKYILPNFFCDIIETVFIEEKVDYSFYHVQSDLTLDPKEINTSTFDVLYLINYFGYSHSNIDQINLSGKTLIEDNVFSLNFRNTHQADHWFSFNSFRKISPLADGSLIKTNLDIDSSLIKSKPAEFSSIKYKAKALKAEFIHQGLHSESSYLEALNLGEQTIDSQTDIYSISPYALAQSQSGINNEIETKRYQQLSTIFQAQAFSLQPNFHSFFPLKVKNKTNCLKALRAEGIFLPSFWPESSQENPLYDTLICIPLFANYDENTFNYLVDKIKHYISN